MSSLEEKREAFKTEINQWSASQSILFQLRYCSDKGLIFRRVFKSAFVLFLLLIIIGSFFFYNISRTVEKEGFRNEFSSSLESYFSAETVELGRTKSRNGQLEISSLKIKGGDYSFFEELEATVIATDMGLWQSLSEAWVADAITISMLSANIRTGHKNDELASATYEKIFANPAYFKFKRINIEKANFTWGFSESAKGSITGTRATILKNGDDLKIICEGGVFSYQWINQFEIDYFELHLDAEKGVSLKKAELSKNNSSIEIVASFGSGSKPQVDGEIQMENLSLEDVLPSELSYAIQGTISTRGSIAGRMNDKQGVISETNVDLSVNNELIIRDRLPLISNLGVIDSRNNYRVANFVKGGFKLSIQSDKLSITDLNLDGENDYKIRNSKIFYQHPSSAEIAKFLNIENVEAVKQIVNHYINTHLGDDKSAPKSIRPIPRAALNLLLPGESIDQKAVFKQLSEKYYIGELNLGVNENAFAPDSELIHLYPFDEKSGKRWVKVPLLGHYAEAAKTTTDKLRELSK